MKYVIHATIIFNTTEYTVKSINTPHLSVKLSNSAGRVLEELVKYHNTSKLVTREHLFNVVWRTYGVEPSNGNLNQQISLIRKIFTNFGLHGSSIVTIPKRGLKLNHQLTIEKIKHETLHNKILSKEIISDIHRHNNNVISSTLLNSKSYIKYIITSTMMMIIILFMGFIYLQLKQNNIKLYCCKEIDSCNICTFHSIPGYEYHDENIQYSEII